MPVMKPLYTAARTLSVATALTVIFAGSAYALDGNDVAKRLQARFEEQGTKIAFGKVETDGTTVTLRDTKVTVPNSEIGELPVGDIVLKDVAEDGKGAYTAETATFQDFSKTDDKTKIDVKGIEIGKIYLAADNEEDVIAKMMAYQTFKVDSLVVAEDGQEMANIKDISAKSSAYTKGTPMTYEFGVKSIDLDIEKMEEVRKKSEAESGEATPNPMIDLGYKQLKMAITSTGSWEPEKGDLVMDKMEFDVADLGKFDTTLKLGGYDTKFIKAIQEANKKLADSGENNDAATMAMLGLMQQLSIGGISFRYDDASLTPKLLEYYGKQQGISSEDMVNQIKGIAPLMVGYLGHADFAIQATTALNTYLDDPKSLTIAAKPDAPVSFALIAATATADPKKLIDLLAVKLTANQ
ncbi:hypothetical protein [Pseudochrobactrum asaccharolyticum]|uniref:Uncharacterized protein n=1 Tax=Pseudochrobactrum asaccharolyticum TaxID=354351 RepID=A0A366E9X8_9HYPH|nr:hypothetical protein [Pseudochrobactrum asaccharolyticum]MBX8800492.1 hypothetical protein [Ochrobactrum sp. MR28]MBX8816192.1 hypothetical protein [Ochrobactrum sp. MR31]RBO98895.1 hypothetical protein DFR47_101498 [Pseudochrobactrum asaccharolyticum]